ncbi:MAG TPA: TonB-dependent receptor [Candidatus Heimdallarchaeota archaeon]|nr:TonB-dependent receptor [Candidatus Heimdallarchaeota archaeon]
MSKNIKRLAISLSIFLIVSALISAQTRTGTLKVIAIDDEGNVIPGVTLTLSSPVMMGEKSLVTNVVGEALFVNLTPGVYELKSSIEGFQGKVSESIEVSIGRQTILQVELNPATIEEQVTVTAVSPAVDTTKSVIAEYVTQETMESLPIARDFVGYLQLAAGINIVPNSGGRDMPQDPAGKGGQNYYDRGLQGADSGTGGGKRGSRDNLYFLDGMNITGLASQTALMTFNNEVIQEQELMTSGVPAEYGGGKGVVGNIVTKSGGNRFSGSANFYIQPESFWLPYGGSEYDNADDPTMLEGFQDNQYDTAGTLGGPFIRDKLWFFLSGQYRNNSRDFQLSESASSTRETVDYMQKRYGLFGKLTLNLSPNDSFSFLYFFDTYDIEGLRDPNSIKVRQSMQEYDYNTWSVYYQRVFGDNVIVDARYGRYVRNYVLGPRYPDAGIPDSLYYKMDDYPPIEQYTFGGFPDANDDKNTRDQLSASVEWYLGNHRFKGGLLWSNEYDKDEGYYHFGENRSSVASMYSGATLGDLLDWGIFPASEMDERLVPYLNNNWDSTSEFYDLNGDGVVTREELETATFTDQNEAGLNFWRIATDKRGVNKVHASRYMGYVMDDWRISDYFTINAGVRIEKHNYYDSESTPIIKMPLRFLPRVGFVWNIGGRGTQKLTLFYGQFSDPIPFGMIHFGGNISGSITLEQMWLNHDWYTYRVRGSAETRDCSWTPNTRDNFAHEFSMTYEIDVGDGLVFSTQGYFRGDRRIIEDYDLFTYVQHYEGDPTWGHLDLSFEDFGYGPEGPTGPANYFLSNLIGAKRDIYGVDFEVSKRWSSGSFAVAQYSFKHAKGNSQSDGNADLQGDFITLDPRNPWMMGPTPGTIPHKIKLFGTYRTPFGLDVGALFYWVSGIVFTESYDFLPGRYSIYYNWPLNEEETDFVQTGQEMAPGYYQIDLKFNYTFRFAGTAALSLFCDIYNVTNNQGVLDIQYARNDKSWDYKQAVEILMPMRFYVGARIRF